MVAEAQTCAIGIITILNILVALYLSRVLYKSTLFMQNKPNFPDAQMNASSILTKDYRKNDAFAVQKNKAKTNPIKPNFTRRSINEGGLVRRLVHRSPLGTKMEASGEARIRGVSIRRIRLLRGRLLVFWGRLFSILRGRVSIFWGWLQRQL